MVRSGRLRRRLARSLISPAPYSKLFAQFHRMRPAEQQSTLAPILAQVLLVMAAGPLDSSTRTLLNLKRRRQHGRSDQAHAAHIRRSRRLTNT